MEKKKLTSVEGLMTIAGAGIGTGILTLPYAVNKIGIFGTLVALVIAYIISLLTYYIIADLTRNSKNSNQLLGILQEHLFKGKSKKIFTNIFFVILSIILIEDLIVYILCATDIISDMFGITSSMAKIIFYILEAIVMTFGLKGVGIGEKYSVSLIALVVVTLIVLSIFNVNGFLSLNFGEPKLIVAVYGLFMYAFSTVFSIIQVTNNIEKKEDIKKIVTGGLTINAVLTILFAIATIIGSKQVTEVAIIGLSEGIGIPFVKILCSGFAIVALFFSYWVAGLAFADIVSDHLKVSQKAAWFLSTLPTIFLSIILPLSILNFVQIGAGAFSIIIGITVLPAYYIAVKNSNQKLLLGKLGKSKFIVWIVGIFTFIMGISSFINVG